MIINLIQAVFYLFIVLVLLRCVLSLFLTYDPCERSRRGNNIFFNFLYDFTEPILRPFRTMLPSNAQLDISPILALTSLSLSLQCVLSIYSHIFKFG
ncbi:MAG: YggT family protein [Cyanobacteriota bacterium]